MKRVFLNNCWLVIYCLIIPTMCFGQESMLQFEYLDGNGNAYMIYENEINYFPVHPSESSSGIYDGGDTIMKRISGSVYDSIEIMIQDLVADTTNLIQERVKLSGLIRVYKTYGIEVFIISPKSERLLYFEKTLKRILKS